MKMYQYVVLDTKGKEVKGNLEADSPRHARQILRSQSRVPISIQAVDAKRTFSHENDGAWQAALTKLSLPFFEGSAETKTGQRISRFKIASKDLAVFTRQLSTLMSAGLAVEAILKGLADEQKNSRVQRMLLSIRARVLEGHSLSFGLAEFPRSFPMVFRASVEAGEQAGQLAEVLMRLADLTEKNYYMRQKINQALIYPATMLTVSMGIVIFLMMVVVPNMIETFAGQDAALPMATQILIWLSDVFSNHALMVLGMFVLLLAVASQLLKRRRWRYLFDSTLLKLPVIGSLTRQINTARFSRTLGILYGSGAPIMTSLGAASAVIQCLPMKKRLEVAVQKIKEGSPISRALKASDDFSSLTIQLIASGESSGRLEEMLLRAAHNEEQEIEGLINKCLTLFEPLLILVMGGIVLFICLAIFLPIFELTNLVGI